MRDTLSAEEVDFYREQGFLVIEDLLSTDELDQLRSTVESALSSRGKSFLPTWNDSPVNDMFSDIPTELAPAEARARDYYMQVFTQRVNLWQTDEQIRRFVLDEQLGRLAAQLAGVDAIRLWSDQALIKEPFANPTAFHLDGPLWSFYDASAFTIWIALDDATLENGCLCYIPGSHKVCSFDQIPIGEQIGGIFDSYPELAGIDVAHCPVPAGGAVVHNGLMAHGAGANMTAHRRRAMTVQFMPDGATFNGMQNVLPNDYFNGLSVGDRLDNDELNPLLFPSVMRTVSPRV